MSPSSLRSWRARSARTSRRTATGRSSTRRPGADRRGHVHVAQSLFHDIEPANELGIPSIWINRLGEPEDPRPTATLHGVGELANALDALVPYDGTPSRPDEATREVARLLSEGSPEPVGRRASCATGRVRSQIELDARLGPGSYAFVDGFGDGRVWIDVDGHPTAELLDWAESRARELGSRLISGAGRHRSRFYASSSGADSRSCVTSYRMAIDLDEPTPEPVWPDGVERARIRARRRAALLRPAPGDVQGLVGADRRDVRRVGPLVPRRRRSGSGALVARSRRRRAGRPRDLSSARRGRRARMGARARCPQAVSTDAASAARCFSTRSLSSAIAA